MITTINTAFGTITVSRNNATTMYEAKNENGTVLFAHMNRRVVIEQAKSGK